MTKKDNLKTKIQQLRKDEIVSPEILDRHMTLGFSTNGSKTWAGQWKNIDCTFEQVLEMILEWEEGPKDGKSLLQGECINGVRKAKAMKEMNLIMFDCDTGEDIDNVIDNIEELGCLAIIWTTHSHLSSETYTPFDGIIKFLRNHRKQRVDNVELAHVKDYLTTVKRWKKHIVDTVELNKRFHNEDGIQQAFTHDPIPKYRILLILEEPFVFAERGTSHQDAINEWKGYYMALGKELGLDFDSSCTDPSRLMYTPRVDEKTDDHFIEIISGDPIDLSEFQPIEVGVKKRTNRNKANNDKSATTLDYDGVTVDLVKWVLLTKGRLMLADAVREEAPDIIVRDVDEDKIDIVCPNSDQHSKGVQMGFFVTNSIPEENSSWNAFCMHDSCQHSGIDRLGYLKALIESGELPISILGDCDYYADTEEDPIDWEAVQKIINEQTLIGGNDHDATIRGRPSKNTESSSSNNSRSRTDTRRRDDVGSDDVPHVTDKSDLNSNQGENNGNITNRRSNDRSGKRSDRRIQSTSGTGQQDGKLESTDSRNDPGSDSNSIGSNGSNKDSSIIEETTKGLKTENNATPEGPYKDLRGVIDDFLANPDDDQLLSHMTLSLAAEENEIKVAQFVDEIHKELKCGKTALNRMISKKRSELKQIEREAEQEEIAELDIEWPPHPTDPSNYSGPIYQHWDFDVRMEVLISMLERRSQKNPQLFQGPAGETVRIKGTDGQEHLQPVKENEWIDELYRFNQFIKIKAMTGEHVVVPPFPECVKALMGAKQLPFPALKGIINTPIYGDDGEIHKNHGYKESTQCYLINNMRLKKAELGPDEKHIKTALYYLLYNALTDFPFSDAFSGFSDLSIKLDRKDRDGWPLPNLERGKASRAHALAMIIEPFVRPIIKGPTPLYHIDKSAPGTGAGYLANVASFIFSGCPMPAQTVSQNKEEFKKVMTAGLRFPEPYLFLDNINHHIDNADLASALTTGKWRDRILGGSIMTSLPINHTWIAAGNNVSFSEELIRRIIPIRMDANMKNPAIDRGIGSFKVFPLSDWLMEHRKQLVWSVHILINNWINNYSMVDFDGPILNSFEMWSNTLGGILQSAGVDGFLENLDNYRNNSTDESDSLDAVAQHIYDQIGLKEQISAKEFLECSKDFNDSFMFRDELHIRDYQPSVNLISRRMRHFLDQKIFLVEDKKIKKAQKIEKASVKVKVKLSSKKVQGTVKYGFFKI